MAKNKEETPKKKVAAKSLDELMKDMTKEYGPGTLTQGRNTIVKVDVFPTNVPTIDLALGCGGIPQGRIVEIFGLESSGKTTTCLHFIAACQKFYFENKKRKGVAAFIDAEHAFDPTWAEKCGVNTNTLLFSQPNSGEEAFEVIEKIVETGLVDLVIVDSVANLVPMKELDGEMDDANIGAQAKMMSKGLRKISGKTHKSKTTVVFVNQIRNKIGVMYGCFHADTLINFVDGRSMPISHVVRERVEGDVWSYDEETRTFVPRPIIDWHYNGDVTNASDYVSIAIKGPGTKNGRMQLTATPTHKIMTDNGWVEADNLVVGDKLLTKQESFVLVDNHTNSTLGQFLTGVLSGDSHVTHNPGRLVASLKIRNNIDYEYMKWKVDRLSAFMNFTKRSALSGDYYESDYYSELLQIKNEYPNRDPMLLLNNFSWLGFSVWLMDDAIYERNRYQLSIKRFAGNSEKIEQISRALDELGLYHHASKGGSIIFDKAVSDYIAGNISEYIPPCMRHKLPTNSKEYVDFALQRDCEWRDAYATIVGVRDASGRQMKNRGKFDISIAGTKCYSAGGSTNGVIVHNSPETTPGGLALKFYASVRMDIRKGSPIKEGDVTLGFSPTLKIIKNKVAPPFTTASYDICVGHPLRPVCGIDVVSGLIEVGVELGIIERSGSSYYIINGQKYNGKAAADNVVRNNLEVQKILREKIYSTFMERANAVIASDSTSEEDENPELADDILDGVTDGDD